MTSDIPIYKSTTSILKYFVPDMLFVATSICFAICYLNGLNFIVPAVLGLFTLTTSFNDTLTIKVYDDKFEFNYTNVFGNFLGITNTYFFDEIKLYTCVTDDWKPSIQQSALMVLLDFLLPNGLGSYANKTPKAFVEFTKTNKLSETKNIKLTIELKNKTQKKSIRVN